MPLGEAWIRQAGVISQSAGSLRARTRRLSSAIVPILDRIRTTDT
jgi:hypothetical protein